MRSKWRNCFSVTSVDVHLVYSIRTGLSISNRCDSRDPLAAIIHRYHFRAATCES